MLYIGVEDTGHQCCAQDLQHKGLHWETAVPSTMVLTRSQTASQARSASGDHESRSRFTEPQPPPEPQPQRKALAPIDVNVTVSHQLPCARRTLGGVRQRLVDVGADLCAATVLLLAGFAAVCLVWPLATDASRSSESDMWI